MTRAPETSLSRRQFALGVGATALAACSPGADTGTQGEGIGTHGGWATGGTAAMAEDYPDPFSTAATGHLTQTCAMPLGPCYTETLERQDISEGHDGLPVRLALRLVDTDGHPAAGAEVDIWHAAPSGFYSGEDAAEGCTDGEGPLTSGRAFRGTQTATREGRVNINTCFPGWYPSRTPHIHLTIRRGHREEVTTQLFFAQLLVDEICAVHPDYSARGRPDTTNRSDAVLGDADPSRYTLTGEKQSDGVLLAHTTIVIRSSRDVPLCSASASG